MKDKVQIILYTKPGCGLCDKMKTVMKSAGIPNLYTLEEVNIQNDSELFARYRNEIPVLFINGNEAFRHRLTAEDFRAYVTSLA